MLRANPSTLMALSLLLTRALDEARRLESFILFFGYRLDTKSKLAAEVLIVWCHCEGQSHVFREEILQHRQS